MYQKSKGCKEQLIIDAVVLQQTRKNRRNLHTAYIDYKKAFDSIPHSWLIHILKIYRINPSIINFLEHTMQLWSTSFTLRSKGSNIQTKPIPIKRGIFQGDCLSALWFCIALNPLSNLLNNSSLGFPIRSNRGTRYSLNHLLYMDDLKIYASKTDHLEYLLNTTMQFSDDICMEFGLDKCRALHIIRGKTSSGTNSNTPIPDMDEEELYKYLGMLQSLGISETTMKETLQTEFKNRLHQLLKSSLNGRNTIKSINTYAIPVLTYSFGIINWTQTELQNLQRLIRTTMTKYKMHHPKSCVERMTMPRKMGGRGVIDITEQHQKQITLLRQYFFDKGIQSELHKAISEADRKCTPLRLSENIQITPVTLENRDEQWARKPLHGKIHHALNDPNVDSTASNEWLSKGDLYSETEGFMLAIQDEVIPTRNYRKFICKDSTLTTDLCRKCNNYTESIDHITAGCTTLTQSDYLQRHNQVAGIIHQEIAQKHGIIKDLTPYYKYHPESVVENNKIKLYFDRTILTNNTVEHNRPDITILDKTTNTVFLVDIAVPLARNMQKTYAEKQRKYSDLAYVIKAQWRVDRVFILPVIISSTGLIHKDLQQNLDKIGLRKGTTRLLQKSVILNTCHIVRNFLSLDL